MNKDKDKGKIITAAIMIVIVLAIIIGSLAKTKVEVPNTNTETSSTCVEEEESNKEPQPDAEDIEETHWVYNKLIYGVFTVSSIDRDSLLISVSSEDGEDTIFFRAITTPFERDEDDDKGKAKKVYIELLGDGYLRVYSEDQSKYLGTYKAIEPFDAEKELNSIDETEAI